MRFFLFLLANGLLFIRPSEFIAELSEFELYRYVIVASLLVSLPVVLQQFSVQFVGLPPIFSCVVLLLPSVVLSGFFHGDLELMAETTTEFVKVLIYFLLMLGLLTDVKHVRQFLYALGLFSAMVTLVAVLRYHSDAVKPPPVKEAKESNPGNKIKNINHGTFVVEEVRDPETGQMILVNRMCGTGIFNDPNDLALVLVTGIPLSLYWLTDPHRKATRTLWLLCLLLFGYALMLTHSRGGFIAMVAGLATLVHLRFGLPFSRDA
jgi:putative inorganic carbon (hco3(-)) transporter